MSLPTPKQLKDLANACRKSGIKHFKCGDIEFTLEEKAEKTRKQTAAATSNNNIETDGLTPDQLLFWSSAPSDG